MCYDINVFCLGLFHLNRKLKSPGKNLLSNNMTRETESAFFRTHKICSIIFPTWFFGGHRSFFKGQLILMFWIFGNVSLDDQQCSWAFLIHVLVHVNTDIGGTWTQDWVWVTLGALIQGYKLTHITVKVSMVSPSMILHRTVHEVYKEPPHSTPTHMAKT